MKLYTQRLEHDTNNTHTHLPTLALTFDIRQKSRFKAKCDNGEEVGIDLPRTGILRHGDTIATDSGDILKIVAALQHVMQVTANTDSNTASFDLMRAAYHLGNRHVPLMLTPTALYFEPDHVLAAMLIGLGVQVTTVQHPFEPETGAYAGHGHGHGHGDDKSHISHPQDLIKANFVFMG